VSRMVRNLTRLRWPATDRRTGDQRQPEQSRREGRWSRRNWTTFAYALPGFNRPRGRCFRRPRPL